MARQFTAQIEDTQCIGDSLVTINDNYLNLDTAMAQLSSKASTPITTNNPTSTIQLSLNSNLNLTGSVRENSITGGLLAPGNIINIVNYNITDMTAIVANTVADELIMTPFNAAITPSNSLNRILIVARLSIAPITNPVGIFIKKGSSSYSGVAETGFQHCLAVVPASVNPVNTFLQIDTGAAGSNSEIIFNFIAKRTLSYPTAVNINRSSTTTAPNNFKTTSNITLYEIKS